MPARKPTAKKKAPKAQAKDRVKPGTTKQSAEERAANFVEAYIANGENGTQAAIDIGLSPKSAHVLASRLLKDVKVQALLSERRAEARAAFKFEANDALRSLAQAVHFDPRKLFHPDGTRKEIHELDDDTAMALASFETVEMVGVRGPAKKLLMALKAGHLAEDLEPEEELEEQAHGGALKRTHDDGRLSLYTTKVKWYDKNVAREQAMKHFGHYEKDHQQAGDSAVRALLDAIALNAASIAVKP